MAVSVVVNGVTYTIPQFREQGWATSVTSWIQAVSSGIGAITNANIAVGAAIAYAKLNLTNSIVNADIASAAAIAYSKLSLATSILNSDINASAAIAYTKLSLANSIVNADIATAAAIAYAKLSLTNSLVNADIASNAAISKTKLLSNFLTATTVSPVTPGGANQWITMTGNSLTLTAGIWRVLGFTIFDWDTSVNPAYTSVSAVWAAANGGNTGSTPSQVIVNGTFTAGYPFASQISLTTGAFNQLLTPTSEIRIVATGSCPIYLVPNVLAAGSITHSRVSTSLYAEQIG